MPRKKNNEPIKKTIVKSTDHDRMQTALLGIRGILYGIFMSGDKINTNDIKRIETIVDRGLGEEEIQDEENA